MSKMKIREFQLKGTNHVIKLVKEAGLYHKPYDNKKNFMKKKRLNPDLILVAEENKNVAGFILGQ